MNRTKSGAALLVLLAILFTICAAPAQAATEPEARMQCFSMLIANVENVDGRAECAGTFTIYGGNYDVDMVVTLERSTDKSTWSSVSGESWSDSFYAIDLQSVRAIRNVIGMSGPLSHGYYYRSRVVASAFHPGGSKPVEVAQVTSRSFYY